MYFFFQRTGTVLGGRRRTRRGRGNPAGPFFTSDESEAGPLDHLAMTTTIDYPPASQDYIPETELAPWATSGDEDFFEVDSEGGRASTPQGPGTCPPRDQPSSASPSPASSSTPSSSSSPHLVVMASIHREQEQEPDGAAHHHFGPRTRIQTSQCRGSPVLTRSRKK